MNQVIPKAAVEAALSAYYDRGGLNFASSHPSTRTLEMEDMSAALEAAAPHMAARAVEYLDESLTVISADPNASDYERGFDDATRGMAAKVKRLLNGAAK